MTDPAPVEPAPTEPTQPEMTLAELDRAIVDASREYIAAQRARPRDQARIDDARAALDDLLALREQLIAAGVAAGG